MDEARSAGPRPPRSRIRRRVEPPLGAEAEEVLRAPLRERVLRGIERPRARSAEARGVEGADLRPLEGTAAGGRKIRHERELRDRRREWAAAVGGPHRVTS